MSPAPRPKANQAIVGQKYQDTITGFIGTATCRAEYLYGWTWVTLEGTSDAANSKSEKLTVEEQRLAGIRRTERQIA